MRQWQECKGARGPGKEACLLRGELMGRGAICGEHEAMELLP